jgi:hypothetical protein
VKQVSAKIKVQSATPLADGQVAVVIGPDYEEGRNAEWAKSTPGLGIQMTVKEEVAEAFQAGATATLLFQFDE